MARRRLLILALATVGVLLGGTLTVFGSSGETYKGFPVVTVVVNNQKLEPDVPAIIMDDRTLMPVRAVTEALGAKVEWDESTYTVKVTLPKEATNEEFEAWKQEAENKFGPLLSEYLSMLADFSQGRIDRSALNEKTVALLPKVEDLVRSTSAVTSSDPEIRETIQGFASVASLLRVDSFFQVTSASDKQWQETSNLLHQATLNVLKNLQMK